MAKSPILRVASFVMPYYGHDGEHENVRQQLVATFGGYTSWEVYGRWASSSGDLINDTSVKYEVAYNCRTMMDRECNFEKLSLIAVQAGQALGQQAVYLVRHDGTALILEVV